MTDVLQTSLSGLVAFQKALATTGNNIANANTPGYSRQRVQLVTRPPQAFGNGFIGAGVDVATVTRYLDQFAVDQLRSSTSDLGQLTTYADFANRVDNVLGDPRTGLAASLQAFFNGWQTLANDPASVTNRQLLIGQAQTLVNQFQQASARLASIGGDVTAQIGGAVTDINSLATSIAALNDRITRQSAAVGGQPPNDLLDQRDQLLLQLGKLVDVKTTTDPDGAVNVFIGNGQPLVLRGTVSQLTTVRNSFDASRLDIAYNGNGAPQTITSSIKGGSLGGLLNVQTQLLDPARNALGRIAVGLAAAINSQQAQGIDLRGQLGQALFSVPAPAVYGAATNTGTAVVSAAISTAPPTPLAAVGALTNADYELRFDGTNWTAIVSATGQLAPLTGAGASGVFQVNGVTVTIGAGAAAGDRFLVRPTQNAAARIAVATTDPRALAAAGPLRAAQSIANVGTGSVGPPQVVDITNANLLLTATITFSSPTTYTVNGGPAQPYTVGGAIVANGWQVAISGAPAAGDSFTVQANSSGVGDNRNALAMAGYATQGVLDGGTTGLGSGYSGLVATVGSSARQANLARDAQLSIADGATQAVQNVSGVNLDEEAADLLRWQQAYGAAAKVVTIAGDLFQTLLAAVKA